MARHEVSLEVVVVINTTDEGEIGIDRYVGLKPDNEWSVKPNMSKEDVLVWLATSTVYGRQNANQDGFADLDPEAITSRIDDVGPY